MSILNILNELAATASTNEKEAILRREKDNELLKRVFQAAYNQMITFGIKQIPSGVAAGMGRMTLKSAIEELSRLSSREFTGNEAIKFLSDILHAI